MAVSIGSVMREDKTECLLLWLLHQPGESNRVCSSYGSSSLLPASELMLYPPFGGSDFKEISLQSERPGFDPWVGKIPWRRERLPTLAFWPGEFHGLYSLWGHKELDTNE